MAKLLILENFIIKNKNKARAHLKEVFNIKDMTDDTIFYLLAFCLLVPGGKATKARLAILALRSAQYYYRDMDGLAIYDLLKSLVRFPNQKTKRLIKLKANRKLITDIKYAFTRNADHFEFRKYLVNTVEGLGYKASSHFLRNLGADNLAIIDTHILKYTECFSNNAITKEGLTKTKYIALEEEFRQWANRLNLKVNELDWLIWCLESNNEVTAFTC